MDEMNQVPYPPVMPTNMPYLPALPNATTSLVLGIISIVTCWCYGIIGLILGIIGLVLGNKAVTLYRQSPGMYSEASFKNANAGKICSIIGLILGGLYVFVIIAFWSTVASLIGGFIPWSDLLK
jgi:hypothetical protein